MKKIIIFCLIIGLISFTYFVSIKLEDKKIDNFWSTESEINEEKEILELKKQLGIIGETDIYTIVKEFDGRKSLVIKPDIQYNILIAGILIDRMPNYEEVENVLQDAPRKNGIWISKKSRNKVLEIINSSMKAKYIIDEEGYLKQDILEGMNEFDKKIGKIISSNKLFVIDINKSCYIIDNVTGKIVEDSFEEMDPYTPFEYFETNNNSVFIITTNSEKKLNSDDIVKEIIESIDIYK